MAFVALSGCLSVYLKIDWVTDIPEGGDVSMEYQDMVLECTDSSHDDNTSGAERQFTFDADEQTFFAEKGFSSPQRCPACRAAKKARFQAGSAPKQLHTITCADCGREDQVPFLPKGDRPVYCSQCFTQ